MGNDDVSHPNPSAEVDEKETYFDEKAAASSDTDAETSMLLDPESKIVKVEQQQDRHEQDDWSSGLKHLCARSS